ncbi:hypothetical protein PAPYR_1394 [Paratrimastix pyriformis]|uniref:Uncharacterized protein n=1 Tax=Paratrimastix pyriformis TaxID=342808 RepID=A0ABQ8USU0_9EUKA|nr:hypothetical protein PAPYR_1394 [Paratrimastix pyriformis]
MDDSIILPGLPQKGSQDRTPDELPEHSDLKALDTKLSQDLSILFQQHSSSVPEDQILAANAIILQEYATHLLAPFFKVPEFPHAPGTSLVDLPTQPKAAPPPNTPQQPEDKSPTTESVPKSRKRSSSLRRKRSRD